MDLKGVRESKNFVDHTNYINRRDPAERVTPDVDLFWKMMRQGLGEDNYISHITDPTVNPTGPKDTNPAANPHDLLTTLLLHLLQRN